MTLKNITRYGPEHQEAIRKRGHISWVHTMKIRNPEKLTKRDIELKEQYERELEVFVKKYIE